MTSAERPRASLPELLREIAGRPNCRVLPARGPAHVPRNASLPDELRQFHDLCGGVLLFEDASFPRRVCGPGGFVPASPRLLTPEVAQQVAKDNPADLTNNCYVIVDGGQGLSTEPHVVMDLAPQRSGRCYTAAWDTYGLPGEMPLIATTIVELLQALLVDRGVEALPAGLSAGDAYDL